MLSISRASVVEALVEHWLGDDGLPERGEKIIAKMKPLDLEKIQAKATPAVPQETVARRQVAIRAAINKRQADTAVQAKREYDQRCVDNPCRLERCRIDGLHPADDLRHSRKLLKGAEDDQTSSDR